MPRPVAQPVARAVEGEHRHDERQGTRRPGPAPGNSVPKLSLSTGEARAPLRGTFSGAVAPGHRQSHRARVPRASPMARGDRSRCAIRPVRKATAPASRRECAVELGRWPARMVETVRTTASAAHRALSARTALPVTGASPPRDSRKAKKAQRHRSPVRHKGPEARRGCRPSTRSSVSGYQNAGEPLATEQRLRPSRRRLHDARSHRRLSELRHSDTLHEHREDSPVDEALAPPRAN